MKLKAIIVDDEYSAREILNQLVTRFCSDVEIVAVCSDVESAVQEITLHKPDIVFLDVEMPKYAGYEIVEFFDEINFNIIFVTAYDKYAIKAFEVSALDYLLKPIEIEKLKGSVEKAKRQVLAKSYKDQLKLLATDLKKSEQKYAFADKGFTNYVNVEEIIAFEAQRAYTKMHLTNNRSVTISKNIKTIEEEIKDFADIKRVHRSWIMNKIHLEKHMKSTQELHLTNGIVAKLSRQHKDSFEALIALRNK